MSIYQQLETYLGIGKVQQQQPLADHTTFRVGGKAEFFYRATTTDGLIKAVYIAKNLQLGYFILGGGSNVLISDNGLSGLVIKNESRSIKLVKTLGQIKQGKTLLNQVLIQADSGVLMNQLVRFTCEAGWQGLEYHLGLPGTVGGAIYINAKWTKPYTTVGDVLYGAQVLDRTDKVKKVTKPYFRFDYDQSILQQSHDILLSASFLLKKELPSVLWYRANESIKYRTQTQPIGLASGGCTFRNISLANAIRLGTPDHTISAGYLLDQVGLKKFKIGGAYFSGQHANFIINDGSATAGNIKQLIDEAKKRVKHQFNIDLKLEIVLLGNFD